MAEAEAGPPEVERHAASPDVRPTRRWRRCGAGRAAVHSAAARHTLESRADAQGRGAVGQHRRASAAAPRQQSYLLNLLFGFEGRLQRSSYRLYRMVMYAALAGMLWALANALRVNSHDLSAELLVLASGAVGVSLWWWVTLALQVKRWHDLDKSGTWAFVGLIPAIGYVWVMVELLFNEGTPGPNRFGPSPKFDAATVFEA